MPNKRSPRSAKRSPALRKARHVKQVRRAIERMLHEHVHHRSTHGPHHYIDHVPEPRRNIVGVGLAHSLPTHGVLDPHAAVPGEQALTVYVAEPRSPEEIKAALKKALGDAALGIDDLPIHVIVSGPIRAQGPAARLRPVPGGTSSGFMRGASFTGGSMACVVTGLNPPRSGQRFVLSNNHVYADVNAAQPGDCLCQPCVVDGGQCPQDGFATVERSVPIDFFRANLVDAALGLARPQNVVRPDILVMRAGIPTFIRISPTPVDAVLNMTVAKSGRTTQLTVGQIIDTSASIHVAFGPRSALFQDQLTIRGTGGLPFSSEGDSGSLVWTFDAARSPVGLLFSAGGFVSFANKIDAVLTALDVQIVS